MDSKKIPEGRLGRFARLASLGARTGANLLLSGDAHQAVAKQTAEVLGNLRGLAAKVGQMASYVDGVVPEEHRETYETALRGLRAAAPTSSPESVHRALVEELGAPAAELFREWEETPVASASIGQVHRAVLHDGREVAVKVQHPGIERAVESDLDNGSTLEGMISAVVPKGLGTARTYAEIRERFLEELDYKLEADRQESFARFHADDAMIRIPGVVRDRSARRVLTTEFVRGISLEEAATRSEDERRAWAETLWRYVFRGTLVGRMFNADPHPGNYMFQDDGRIAFLDFGCVQEITADHSALANAAHRAAVDRDDERFRACVIALLGTQGGAHEERATAYTRQCFEPLFVSPYKITRGYAGGLVRGLRDVGRAAFQKDSRVVALPPGTVFMNRLQFGFYSVLARLDVAVDYNRVERTFLGM